MKAELKIITPEWARKILQEKNKGNRAMNAKHVNGLAKEIREGRWKINGDAIRINEERLIDGQHRLAAIALTGIAVQSFVIEGLSSDVFDTIDCGILRSPGHTLGVRGEKNSFRLASALVLTDKYMTGRADKSVEYSNAEVEKLLEKYPDIRECLQVATCCKNIMPPSLLDTCYYIFSKKNKLLADEFVSKVVRGIGLEIGDPFLLLRERLVKNSTAKAKLTKPYILALCIKAWNACRLGKKLRSLRWRESGEATETFPTAV